MLCRLLCFVFIPLLLGALTACDSPVGKALREVDAIIEDDPAKALDRLEQLHVGGMTSADSAYYALLYTQAQIKNYIRVSSDSLISVAYSRYRNAADIDLRRRAHFYKAQVAFYAGDFRESMKDATVAYDLAKDEDNPYWIAKTAELIGDLLFCVYNYEQSEFFKAEAADNYLKADKIRNHRFALSDLATQYLNEGKEKEAVILFDSLRTVIEHEEPFDSVLNHFIMLGLCSVFLDNNQHEELEESLPHDADSLHAYIEEVDIAILKSYVMAKEDDSEKVDRLLAEVYAQSDDEKERIRIMYASYEHLKQAGRYGQALELADSLLYLQSSIAEQMLKESVVGVQRDYYSSKAEYQEHQTRTMRHIIVIVTCIAVFVIFLLVVIFRLKSRAKRAELEANLLAIMNMREQTERLAYDNRRLSSELSKTTATLFRDKWTTLNMLCDEYFEKGDSERTRVFILDNIEKELIKLRSRDSLNEIEASVNAYMGNIVTLLRQECTFLKNDDYIFLSLIYAGLSVRAVCLFMNIKYKMFYLKKSRLSKRILASEAPHRQLFIDRLK